VYVCGVKHIMHLFMNMGAYVQMSMLSGFHHLRAWNGILCILSPVRVLRVCCMPVYDSLCRSLHVDVDICTVKSLAHSDSVLSQSSPVTHVHERM
jgi:hypothetical protein